MVGQGRKNSSCCSRGEWVLNLTALQRSLLQAAELHAGRQAEEMNARLTPLSGVRQLLLPSVAEPALW